MKLTDFLIANKVALDLKSYKIHLATKEKDYSDPSIKAYYSDPPIKAYNEGRFREWQERQQQRNFPRNMVIGLIGIGENKWLFAGVYKVLDCEKITEKHFEYETELLKGQEDLIGRIIVDYKRKARASYLIGLPNGGEFYLSEYIDIVSPDEKEQSEIEIELLKQKKSKAEILKELQNIKETDPETITINGKTYKRDNKTIAQIKILRDFKCQICGLSILKRNGSKYVEAAHIIQHHKKGRATLDNIILLCPNHHKEFDLGDCKHIIHSKIYFEFSLNGTVYKLKL